MMGGRRGRDRSFSSQECCVPQSEAQLRLDIIEEFVPTILSCTHDIESIFRSAEAHDDADMEENR